MRVAVAVVWLLACAAPAGATSPYPLGDEDDPKLARDAPRPPPWWQIRHPVPRLTLAYRRLWLAGLEGGTVPFDVGELDFFPVSNLLRVGIIGEIGWGGGTYGLWYLDAGASLGVQYPARVTPFLEGRFVAGLIGGTFQSNAVVSWMYAGGIDGGVDVYYFRRFYVTAAVGWSHPVYGGVDVAALMANPRAPPIRRTLGNDSVTVKVGLGF